MILGPWLWSVSHGLSSLADKIYVICTDGCNMPIPVEFGGWARQILLATS